MGVPKEKLSLQEFIDWENRQPDRHEFFRGEVFAMVGGRRTHGRVIANLVMQIGLQLRGSPCQVFSESMKLQIADDTILYPDVFVTCDRDDLRTEMIFRSPTVIVEVLSPTTQADDRGQKFALYRRLAGLREYVLIDPDTRRVEVFRLNEERLFALHDMSEATHLDLRSIDCRVALADVFDGVEPAAD